MTSIDRLWGTSEQANVSCYLYDCSNCWVYDLESTKQDATERLLETIVWPWGGTSWLLLNVQNHKWLHIWEVQQQNDFTPHVSAEDHLVKYWLLPLAWPRVAAVFWWRSHSLPQQHRYLYSAICCQVVPHQPSHQNKGQDSRRRSLRTQIPLLDRTSKLRAKSNHRKEHIPIETNDWTWLVNLEPSWCK